MGLTYQFARSKFRAPFCEASTDGTSCAAASTSLLSGSTASYSAGTVTGTMSTLASGSSLALVFRVTVN